MSSDVILALTLIRKHSASLTPTSICAGQTTAASETNEAASGRQIRASSARGARLTYIVVLAMHGPEDTC